MPEQITSKDCTDYDGAHGTILNNNILIKKFFELYIYFIVVVTWILQDVRAQAVTRLLLLMARLHCTWPLPGGWNEWSRLCLNMEPKLIYR